ncbi:hypothetical protein Tco_0866782 [Tanacetum coccineum]
MGSRKETLARKRQEKCNVKEWCQKTETRIMRKEKEENYSDFDLVPREEFAMEIESLGTKYPIVDWKTHVLTENFIYYQIIRTDGGSKNYKIFKDEVWKHQHEYNLISWRLFDSCGIHILKSLTGEASTFAAPITTLSTTFASFTIIPPSLVASDQVLDAEPHNKDPPAMTFEKEELGTSLK